MSLKPFCKKEHLALFLKCSNFFKRNIVIAGKLAWTREESLASIVSVEMVDYPVSPILAKMEDEFGGSGKCFDLSNILLL